MSAALQIDPGLLCASIEEFDQCWMWNSTIERTAAMEAEQAHGRACAQRYIAPCTHVRCVGGENEIKLDRDIRLQDLGRGQRATQIEFFLHRKDEMNCGLAAYVFQRAR